MVIQFTWKNSYLNTMITENNWANTENFVTQFVLTFIHNIITYHEGLTKSRYSW